MAQTFVPKDYRPLVKAAKKAGWILRPKKRHLLLESPDGATLVGFPGTPSDHRSLLNTRAELRRAGVDI